ncbi:hypothetical protein [Streptomyces sp. NPDC019539]|uniref:hypothetical protein n=1 Tax=Streptomyces sp. NPDC019539 TaxID=3365063 RepID=UPI0037940CC4
MDGSGLAHRQHDLRRRAQPSRTPLSGTARRVIADLARESRLRRAVHSRDAAREDFQREQVTTSTTPLGQARRNFTMRRTSAVDRRRSPLAARRSARAVLGRADAVSDKLHAELRFRERLPDHARTAPTIAGQFPTGSPTPTPSPTATPLSTGPATSPSATAFWPARSPTAATPWPTSRPPGSARSASAADRRSLAPYASATTCALVELWRTRHTLTNVPGLGPAPPIPMLRRPGTIWTPGCAP